MGLEAGLDHFPGTVVRGEQQRVAIARAWSNVLRCSLGDEPTGALVFQTGKLVQQVIERINRELGTTTAVITHNAGIVAMVDRVITLRSSQIIRAAQYVQGGSEALEWYGGRRVVSVLIVRHRIDHLDLGAVLKTQGLLMACRPIHGRFTVLAVLGALVVAYAAPGGRCNRPVTRGAFQQTIDEDGKPRVRQRYTVSAPVVGTAAYPTQLATA